MTKAAIAELAGLDQWVISKYVERGGKLDKPPFSPYTRRQCSHSNPAHWSSYATARAALAGFKWLGFVFHESDPYSGIDLDGCCKPDVDRIRTRTDIEDWALRIIDQAHSYTEVSPSGKGVKIFVRGTLPEVLIVSMGEHIGIEVYSTKRYFTVTGQHLAGTPTEIREAQSALDQLQREYKPAPVERPATANMHLIARSTPREGKLSARDTIDQANRDNDLDTYLETKGAALVRSSGETSYYSSIAGEAHDHAYTYIVSPAKRGAGQIGFSYSPNGKLNNVDFRHGFRFFDAYAALDQNGDTIAALKAFSPEPAAPRARQDPPLLEPRKRTPADEAYNARRLEARRADNRAVLSELYDYVNTIELGDRAVLLFAYLHQLADECGLLQVRPTNAAIAAALGLCERSIQRAFRDLEETKIGKRSGGRGWRDSDQPNEAATWTFYRYAIPRVTAPEAPADYYVECVTLSYRTCDLDTTIGACEPRAVEQPPIEPAAPAGWCKIQPDFDDSDQPEIATYDPAAAWIPEAPAPVEPVIVDLDPLVPAPPAPSSPTFRAFITAWYAAQPGAIDKRTGRPRSTGQRDYFRREAERYLVDVSPEEAALRWAGLDRPARPSSGQGVARGAPHKLLALDQQSAFF